MCCTYVISFNPHNNPLRQAWVTAGVPRTLSLTNAIDWGWAFKSDICKDTLPSQSKLVTVTKFTRFACTFLKGHHIVIHICLGPEVPRFFGSISECHLQSLCYHVFEDLPNGVQPMPLCDVSNIRLPEFPFTSRGFFDYAERSSPDPSSIDHPHCTLETPW